MAKIIVVVKDSRTAAVDVNNVKFIFKLLMSQ